MTLAAVRLPAGWSAGLDDEGCPVAGPARRTEGDPLLVHRTVPDDRGSLTATADALAAELRSTCDELMVLDAEDLTCRGSVPGLRLLTAWRDGERGLTAEHWLVQGDDRLHVLVAVMESGRYAGYGADVRAALGSFRHDREPSFGAAVPDGPRTMRPDAAAGASVVLELEVLAGPHPGRCVAVIEGSTAGVRLPREQEIRVISRSLLPGLLAGLVHLVPRPRVPDPGVLVVDQDRLDVLLSTGGPGAQAAVGELGAGQLPDAWTDALTALPGKVQGRWRLTRQVEVAGAVVADAEVVEVVDAGDAGLWQLAPVGTGWLADELAGEPGPARPVAVSALTPTAVWELLTAV